MKPRGYQVAGWNLRLSRKAKFMLLGGLGIVLLGSAGLLLASVWLVASLFPMAVGTLSNAGAALTQSLPLDAGPPKLWMALSDLPNSPCAQAVFGLFQLDSLSAEVFQSKLGHVQSVCSSSEAMGLPAEPAQPSSDAI